MLLFINFGKQILPLGIKLVGFVPICSPVRRATIGVHLAYQLSITSDHATWANPDDVASNGGQSRFAALRCDANIPYLVQASPSATCPCPDTAALIHHQLDKAASGGPGMCRNRR
jgi:hypothetical protein